VALNAGEVVAPHCMDAALVLSADCQEVVIAAGERLFRNFDS
jgi:hypothetical protein